MKRELCNTRCKHGLKARAIFIAWNKREISTAQFKQGSQDIACFCFPCIHNEIKGLRSKFLTLALRDSFQSCDMFEETNDRSKEIKGKN